MSTHIPLDIELEIIKRLPVKSVIRFMSVCKAWKSLVNSSEFVSGYRALPTQPHHLLLRYDVGDQEKPDEIKSVCIVDDDTFPQQKFVPTVPRLVRSLHQSRIIDSSGGLLFLDGFFQEPDKSITNVAVLWNPSIRKSIAVVVEPVVFGPFDSVVGFGVCPYTNDPKLVKVTFINDITEIESISCIPDQVTVFTLSSGEWKPSCSDQLPRKSIAFTRFSTVIGQIIYWRAYDRIDVDGALRNLITSFDIGSEEFTEIDLPDCLADVFKSNISVSRLRESLVLFERNFKTDKLGCDVWMMGHGDSRVFTKLFTINAPNVSVYGTLGFRKSGEPIVEVQDEDEDYVTLCSLGVYEPCSEHIKDLGVHGNIFCGSSYTESLLLLDHDDGCIVT